MDTARGSGATRREHFTRGSNTAFAILDQKVAEKAAELRAKYNLTLTDAFQVGVALNQSCDAFLTNDVTLKRVTELDVIVLDEMQTNETAQNRMPDERSE